MSSERTEIMQFLRLSILRAAPLQHEIAPKVILFVSKQPKNAPKRPRNILSVVQLSNIFHQRFFQKFSRPISNTNIGCTRSLRRGEGGRTLRKGMFLPSNRLL